MQRALVLVLLAACGSPTTTPGDAPTAEDADRPDAAPAGDPIAALQELPARCTADQWCWWRPQPSGIDYSRVYATAPDNIWLVGGGPPASVVMQWNGHEWRAHRPAVLGGEIPDQLPMSIGGNGPTNMWLIYGTTVQQWDGATWTIRDTLPTNGVPNFNSVWVAPDGEAWVTVSNGHVKRWRNGAWQTLDAGCGGCFLGSIWGTSSEDVFITTLPAGILRYDGQTFTPVYAGPKIAAWYQGTKDDVWVSGDNNALMHWDGTAWTPFETGLDPSWLIQFAGALATDDVWWLASRASTQTAFVHWDGQRITTTPIDLGSYGEGCCPSLNSAAIIDGRWWIVGGWGAVYTKAGPTRLAPIVQPSLLGTSMWGTTEADMYFASGGALKHWNGSTMTTLPAEIAGITGVAGAGVGGANELFGVGYRIDPSTSQYVAYAAHFDGASWTRSDLATFPVGGGQSRFLSGLHAMGPGEAMVVGQKGSAYHYKDGTWTPVSTGVTVDLAGVWGTDPDQLWITGQGGTFLQWRRSDPGVMQPDPTFPVTPEDLGMIHGADGITWVVARNTPHVWMKAPSGGWTAVPTNIAVGALFAVSATNVVVLAAGQARMARWNGTAFVPENYGSWRGMTAVFQPPGGKMFVSNGHGIVQHP